MTASHNEGLVSIGAVSKVEELGMIFTSDFKWTDQCVAAARKTEGELLKMKSAMLYRNLEVFVLW